MGYTTNFDGELTIDRQLTLDDYLWLQTFAAERHEEAKFPSHYCQWIPGENGKVLVWDEGEKFYNYVEWLAWLIENFFKPKGYVLNGEITWEGEEQGDIGKIIVTNNKLDVKEGRIVFD
jgi:hypothetical protein